MKKKGLGTQGAKQIKLQVPKVLHLIPRASKALKIKISLRHPRSLKFPRSLMSLTFSCAAHFVPFILYDHFDHTEARM